MAYIKFDNVYKSFGNNHVLKGINLDVDKGKLVTLLGPSGCGKSTLLRCLAGLEQISSGRIYLDGDDITDVVPRSRGVGMVFQHYSLFPNMSVGQNVAYGLKLKKLPKEEIKKRVEEMLTIVGLSEKTEQYPMQLSGGQQQRVALARAMVTQPKVLLLDEPLSAIDALLRKNLQIEIRRIQQHLDITTIFVTHDQDEAMVMSDMIHLFNEGKIEQSGTPSEIYAHPSTKFAATFIGNYNLVSAAKFNEAFSADIGCNDIAIRPEIVKISNNEFIKKDGTYSSSGRIKNHISHGNLVRFNIDFGSLSLNVDQVFEREISFRDGDKVFAEVEDELIIKL